MKILAAFKPTAAGWAALAAAMDEAEWRGAELLVARHVAVERRPPPQSAGPIPGLDASAIDEGGHELAKLRDDLDAVQSDARQRGIDCETVLLNDAHGPAESLLQLASRRKVDLIVVGTRRRSRVGKALLGSESQHILLNADCHVLAVKADEA
jgi:nucleotide-binding universal stress UspA family protein